MNEEMFDGAAVWPVGHVAAARIWSESIGSAADVADAKLCKMRSEIVDPKKIGKV